MATDGLARIVCAVLVLVGLGEIGIVLGTDEERTDVVTATLAVQTALEQGRGFLQRGDARAAVRVLEGQLGRINGNTTYLNVLREAYRAYVRELRQANQETEAARYTRRLQILDPGAALDLANLRSAVAAPTPPAVPSAAISVAPATALPAAKAESKIRLQMQGEEEPASAKAPKEAKPDHAQKLIGTMLARAEEEFTQKHYREAAALFEQVHQADPAALTPSKERWAYCRLHRVVEQLNAQTSGPPSAELEREVRQVMALAPKLDYAKTVLAELETRRQGGPVTTPPTPQAEVRHYERGSDGWARAETANFRIFHNQTRELAAQTAQVAEKTRTEMGRKWFGGLKEDWNPRCDIYLHATAQDYSRVTGVPSNSPGHSTIKNEGSRILARKIDLHCQEPQTMLTAVLPHEATHVVLAGQFGDQPVPRWADEGMAVLTEPREKVDRHLRNLGRCRHENTIFHVRQLITMPDYPEPRYISGFYAQSVSVVEYLSNLKGPQTFAQFLRDGQKSGYEQALSRHYGFRNFDDLQQRWTQHAFAEGGAAVAAGGP